MALKINNLYSKGNPVLLVGDIHGDITLLENAMQYGRGNDTPVVFVGDYVDGQCHSRKKQKKALELVHENQSEDLFYFLRGNHELSYQDHANFGCTGYSSNFHRSIAPIIKDTGFLDYLIVDLKILVTHAGLSKGFIDHCWDMDLESMEKDYSRLKTVAEKIEQEVQSVTSNIFRAGRASDGFLPVGGPFWCRPKYFEPFGDQIVQIFGHTSNSRIQCYPSKKAFCIDSLIHDGQQCLLYKPHVGFEIINIER